MFVLGSINPCNLFIVNAGRHYALNGKMKGTMKRRALVITRTPVFGDQVVQALELDGRYSARAFDTFSAALEDGQREPFNLVVLDSDAADQPLEQAARALRRVCPVTILILVPPGNWVSSALVNRIAPDGMLTKPLSLADLTDLLDETHQRFFSDTETAETSQALDKERPGKQAEDSFISREPVRDDLSPEQAKPAALAPPGSSQNESWEPGNGRGLVIIRKGTSQDSTGASHGWLYDVNRAAQYLARLSMETSAQAALIVRGGKIWAYAGQMSQADAQELAQVVVAQWYRPEHPTAKVHGPPVSGSAQQPDRRDLIRFTRLANEQEFILYATGLIDNLVLALAFDAGIPFRMIRAQAVRLAQALSRPPEAAPSPVPGEQVPLVAALQSPQEHAMTAAALHGNPQTSPPTADPAAGETPASIPMPSLLDDVPPSNPERGSGEPPGGRAVGVNPLPKTAGTISSQQKAGQIPGQQHEARLPSQPGLHGFSIPAGLPISPAILHTGRPDLDNREEIATPPPFPSPFDRALEQPALALEPVTPSLSGLLYTCVMVPRIPTHVLSGDLAARLAEWMPLLCLAYGWRLEKLEQRKEYLAWVVRVQLVTSPSYLMRILRQKTSLRIFADFPALVRDNPSGDFWAPGYLILSSGALPSPDIIRSFIQQTRFYQGGTGPIILSTSR